MPDFFYPKYRAIRFVCQLLGMEGAISLNVPGLDTDWS